MIKNLFSIIIISIFFFSSCNQGTKENSGENKSDTALLTVLSFDTSAHSFVDKPVIIEGTVLHLCKHGGKRMFLVDGSDSVRIEITAGPDITKFEESLIGSRVRVFGTLKEERIDAKYLNEWENELKKPEENHNVGVHTGAKGHEDQGIQEKLDQINALREEIKASGTDHLSNYSIEAARFIELK
jgi:hypothetical protein